MERLTVRDGTHVLLTNSDLSKHRGDACTALLARCAEYEDSGLTPERVVELAQAECDGRLIALPEAVSAKPINGWVIASCDFGQKQERIEVVTLVREGYISTYLAEAALARKEAADD
ncbi:MAG: hypothetical protein FWB91_07945 [Defluviitaleaceae bacterium]|nr:hypothetical protein [Defluviitaleaceae bacterium]